MRESHSVASTSSQNAALLGLLSVIITRYHRINDSTNGFRCDFYSGGHLNQPRDIPTAFRHNPTSSKSPDLTAPVKFVTACEDQACHKGNSKIKQLLFCKFPESDFELL